MAQSYVITGTRGGPGIDNTSEVVLEADEAGNPTKVIGVDQPCELNKGDKAKLEGLGIDFDKSDVSADEVAAAPQVGTDAASAGPKISS
jgi:hypothetical protein